MNTEQLVETLWERHVDDPESRFAFILGAGASVSSGIPTGEKLVDDWLVTLRRRASPQSERTTRRWAESGGLGIDSFSWQDRGSYYPEIFERMFADDKDNGALYLEKLMANKRPSVGYVVLAKILANSPRHNVVITTNFDNLLLDALARYADMYPFNCAHEALAEWVQVRMEEGPVILKVHRDCFTEPMNIPADVNDLPEKYRDALAHVFRHCTPVIIGYNGGDGTLMSCLESAPAFPGTPYWCHLADKPANQRIEEFVMKHKGQFVTVEGFDEVMIRLGAQTDMLPSPLALQKVSLEGAATYIAQVAKASVHLGRDLVALRCRQCGEEILRKRGPRTRTGWVSQCGQCPAPELKRVYLGKGARARV